MPMLADLDDPPKSRWPGMLLGLALALPLVGAFVVWLLPMLVGAILGGAESIDERLRLEDGYMTAVCTTVLDVERDQALCGCVLGTEFPSLDCQAPFLAWSVERQAEHCAVPDNHAAALSFCSCVDVITEKMAAAPDRDAAVLEAQAYRNCQALPDAVYLPDVEALVPAS
jgi:hypothetical protein